LHLYRKFGYWKKIDEIYQSFVQNLSNKPSEDASDIQDMVENYVSALHQEGKTQQAIQTVEQFLQEVRENKFEKIEGVMEWGFNRMGKFYFYLDDYENAKKCLLQLQDYCSVHHSDKYGTLCMPLAGFVELMTSNVELGNEDLFSEMEQKLKSMDADLGSSHYSNMSLVRSKYLISQESVITNHYHLVLKICIKRPRRPEGEYEKPEDQLDRKLTKFFVETFFENPATDEADLHTTQDVDHYDFNVDSPVFTTPAQPYHWYTVKMYLYSDSTKEQLLGKHFQLVYLEPAALQRRRVGGI